MNPAHAPGKEARPSFFEKKEAKKLYFPAAPNCPAMASLWPRAPK
jgi:hypothetical protein